MTPWYDVTEPTEMDLLVGFYDLSGYMKFARSAEARNLFALLAGYFDITGDMIERAGGVLIKTIGDAGFAAFPADMADTGVRTFLAVQDRGDRWLDHHGYPGRAYFKLHLGAAICGPLGNRRRRPFDMIGDTVNIAATIASKGFAMTPAVFRALDPETRKLFKKHTPPVTYIALTDRHTD